LQIKIVRVDLIEPILLSTRAGHFYSHYFKGSNGHLLVFIPGLMEPKAGLFYIWIEMARTFHERGYSTLLFDLAGQGDSLLPLSFAVWDEQIKAILSYFNKYNIHCIARGIGSLLIPLDGIHIAIHPSLSNPITSELPQIRWKTSPFCENFLTPALPHNLSDLEKRCFHNLGAESECIGGLELPTTFLKELPLKLPSHLPDNILIIKPTGHPLFDKQSERSLLTKAIEHRFTSTLFC